MLRRSTCWICRYRSGEPPYSRECRERGGSSFRGQPCGGGVGARVPCGGVGASAQDELGFMGRRLPDSLVREDEPPEGRRTRSVPCPGVREPARAGFRASTGRRAARTGSFAFPPNGRASNVAIIVVSGTDNAKAIPPTAERAISIATASPTSTSRMERPATLNNSSSGNAPPA